MYTNAAKQLLFTPWRSLVLLGEQRSVSPMLIIRLGVELFHGSFLFSSWKREDYMHCMNYSHSNIANLPPVSCTSLCTNTHTHTHTLPFAVMNYVHTVYSLINWRCRLRQKRLHKAIPLLFSTSVHSLHMEMNCSSSAPTKSSAADSLTGLRQNTTSRKSLMNKETGWAAWGLFSSLCVV